MVHSAPSSTEVRLRTRPIAMGETFLKIAADLMLHDNLPFADVAAMFDGGARLLGRVLPIPRGFRLTIVVLAVFGFMYWTFIFTGSELATQAASLQAIVEAQIESIGNRIAAAGFNISAEDVKGFGTQILNSVGRVTAAVTSVVGTVTTTAAIVTGRLRQSLHSSPARIEGDKVIVSIGSAVEYAAAHEFGFEGDVTVREHERLGRVVAGGRIEAHEAEKFGHRIGHVAQVFCHAFITDRVFSHMVMIITVMVIQRAKIQQVMQHLILWPQFVQHGITETLRILRPARAA